MRSLAVVVALLLPISAFGAFAGPEGDLPRGDVRAGMTSLFLVSESPVPLNPGTWWEYRESYTEHLGSLDSTTDEIARFEVHGTVARPFIHQIGGADPVSAPVVEGEGWIRLEVWTGEEALPLPLEVGASGPMLEGEKEPWRVEAEEDVTVPAGTYHALRCALRTPRSVSILWIVPGVGVVHEVQGAPGSKPDVERVLLRWQAAPKPRDPS